MSIVDKKTIYAKTVGALIDTNTLDMGFRRYIVLCEDFL